MFIQQNPYRLLKDDGRFCLNIPLDKNKGGQQSVYADIINIAKKIGFKYHATIIWNEQNISRRTAWGSWLSASAPYVIAPVEMIAVLYKKRWKKRSGSGKSDITKEEFIEWTNGVWTFMGESKSRVGHPAPFPVELPRRCIKLFSFVGDTVLDPFLGSGSTLIACVLTGRKGIGVEIDKNYCELAKNRLLRETRVEQIPLALVKENRINEIKGHLAGYPQAISKGIDRCVVCGRGREDGIEIHADHKIPLDRGGTNTVENGQTLCSEHNLLKKNYSQTEFGKRFMLRLYEEALEKGDELMANFCREILDVYDKYNINWHIKRGC